MDCGGPRFKLTQEDVARNMQGQSSAPTVSERSAHLTLLLRWQGDRSTFLPELAWFSLPSLPSLPGQPVSGSGTTANHSNLI